MSLAQRSTTLKPSQISGCIRGPPWHPLHPPPPTPKQPDSAFMRYPPIPTEVKFANRKSTKSLAAIAWENGKITLLAFIPEKIHSTLF